MNKTVDEKILEEIRQYIDKEYSVLFGITAEDVKSPAIDLRHELGLDSQDIVLMLANFEKKYQLDISDDKAVTIRTVGDVIDLIKRMSSLDWIRNGQVQPAKETVAPKAAEPVQKPAIQKPSAKETTVTLTNIPQGLSEKTKLNCGVITEKQKQDFLASIMRFNAWVTPFNMKCPECGAYEKSECPKYLADGKCTSPLVKRTVGALLFPDKYGNER